jgi:membrane dipeptidase
MIRRTGIPVRLAFNLMNLLIDSHEDLAWNILNLKRDYSQSAHKTREAEKDTPIPAFNGNTLLGYPQYIQANVAVVFGTLFCTPRRRDKGQYKVQVYDTPRQAHECYRENLDVYTRLTDEHPDKFRLIFNRTELSAHIKAWEIYFRTPGSASPPVGIIILMEGAEGIREPSEVGQWFEWGVRLVGPAWAGNQYCGGTGEPGPLTEEGFALLEDMAETGMILDISHMDHQSARQALDSYSGQVIASHANAETLIRNIPINRHLKDDTIHQLIERDGVMGIVPMNAFLDWEWRDHGGRQSISLDLIINQIDHVCQIAGNTLHIGIGTDFDGGFGVESVPSEIDTIADLPKLAPKLTEKGYNETDIANIFSGNWLRILKNNLPTS